MKYVAIVCYAQQLSLAAAWFFMFESLLSSLIRIWNLKNKDQLELYLQRERNKKMQASNEKKKL
jgi:hypothetical protein